MKNIILLLVASAITATCPAQTRTDYDASVNKFQKFYNAKNIDSVYGLFSERVQSMLPLDKTNEMVGDLTTKLGAINTVTFSKQDGHLWYYKTDFTNATLNLVLALNKDNKMETIRFLPYQSDTDASGPRKPRSAFFLKTEDGKVYGTLSVPERKNKIPVVLIIAGSGPTDRDGNSPLGVSANTYKMIADSLFDNGIACARYDKRGVAESADAIKDEESVRFEDLIGDAMGFIKQLKADPRFSKVVVLGHSEGSLIGMIAAQKAKASAYISVSGIADRADKTLEQQIAINSKDLSAKAKILLDSMDHGYTVKNIDPSLEDLFRPSVQNYVISWLRYNPAVEIKKLSVPVLIVQGTTDMQVPLENAEKLKKADPKASLKVIAGMNHILKTAPKDRKENFATYTVPDLPLAPGLMGSIEAFVAGLK